MGSIKGPIMSKVKDLITLMKCSKRTIFWLLMQLHKTRHVDCVSGKRTPAWPWNAAGIELHSCATLKHSMVISGAPVFSSLDWTLCGMCAAGGVSSLFQSHKKARGLERKQLLRNEHWLEGQAYLSLTSLWDCSINTMIDLWASWHSSPLFGCYRESKTGGNGGIFRNHF